MKQSLYQSEKIFVGCLITGFILLAIGFSLGPIFEGPDEIEHYRFVRYLQTNQELPDLAGQSYGQFHQTPLYYLLVLPVALFLPDEDFAQIDGRLNPYHGYNFAQVGNDNKNLYLHSQAELFPYSSQTAGSVHFLRLISVLLGTVTLWTSYQIFCLIWPDNSLLRLMALAIMAFWPQFIYISSVLNNDNLAFMLATISLYLLLYQYKVGASWRSASQLGIVLGLALLTKASLVLLALPVGLATILDKRFWKYAPLTLAITLILAGWWYLRSYFSYGDFLGVNAMWQTWPDLPLREGGTMDLWIGLERLAFVYQTFWARFGQGSVAVGTWIYQFYDAIVLLAIFGLGIRVFLSHKIWRENKSLLVQSAIIFVFAFTWLGSALSSSSVASAGNQGRYLFPGVAAWAILLALGLETWLSRLSRSFVILGIGLVLGGMSLVSLFAYFYPAYQASPVPTTIPQELNIRYEQTAELIGIAPANLEVNAGETIQLELYWRALAPAAPDLQTFVHTAFAENILWRDSIPALGNRPADDWQVGETWAEIYTIEIPKSSGIGTEYLLVAGFYEPSSGEALMAFDNEGNELSSAPIIGILRVVE